MNKKQQINNKNESEIKSDELIVEIEKNGKLLQLLNHPWRLIKEGSSLGINGVRRFLAVVFLFLATNIGLFIYATSRLFSTDFEFSKIFYVILILIIGIVITIYSAYQTYQFVVIETMRVIYENLSSLFHKICDIIIDKTEKLFQSKIDLKTGSLKKALNFGKMINSTYKRMPRFLRKGIIIILKKIPFVGMLAELQDKIVSGNKIQASKELYKKMDKFVSESIFEKNNTKWVWTLFLINILVSFTIILLKIG